MEIRDRVHSGLAVGIKDRHAYVLIACESCGKERWVSSQRIEKPNFHNRCRVCRGQAIRGVNAPNWQGGIIKDKGYIKHHVPGGYIHEHILIWEQVHKKPLPKGWIVHHLNGIKDDNHPGNLVGLPSKKHYFVLAVKAKRIRELEAKVKLLEKILESRQLVFRVEDS